MKTNHSIKNRQNNRIKAIVFLSLITIWVIALSASTRQVEASVHAGGGSGYDLVDAVNSYRAQMGLYALNAESHVMAAAQAHADWIVETGNGGHTGSGGSDETIRAMWAGYGDGATVHCDEAWAETGSAEDAVYNAWSDWTHQGVMLDYWGNGYTDAGGGVADDGNGNYVFVFDICVISGKASSLAPTMVNTLEYDSSGTIIEPTADMSQFIMTVKIYEPAADGSITHIVDYGQTLVQIALAYGVKVAEIRTLNGMAEDNTLIYPEQKLIIKAGANSGVSKEISNTQSVQADQPVQVDQAKQASTSTLAATFTPRVRPTRTATPVVETITPIPVPTQENTPINSTQSIGVVIVTVFVIGLAAFLLFGLKKT